ncbi:MAG: FAD-dependent oxidoreductase [Betaproteobacteria bacterium]|nr:FAD-dependent oxidoreductase [Betaproteobacteria bacterium]
MKDYRPRVALAGAGHAQLGVLQAFRRGRMNAEVTLLSPEPFQIYSGMLPGWIAGHYTLEECRIDLRPLAEKAGVNLVLDRVAALDADRHILRLAGGGEIGYDLLSINVGGEINLSLLREAGEQLLPVKPLNEFIQKWQAVVGMASKRKSFSVVVVGGGAAGVELALAVQYALNKQCGKTRVALVASEKGLLAAHDSQVSEVIRKLLRQRGIELYETIARGVKGGLLLGDGLRLFPDVIIAATGSAAPDWIRRSNLEVDGNGFVVVDATLSSISHRDVFAAGDICVRADTDMARSGVHAVKAGPVLAHNLAAFLNAEALTCYHPRKNSLYLLATGPKNAVVSWGKFTGAGRLAWHWKNWIDQRYMRRHKGVAMVVNNGPQSSTHETLSGP